MLGAVAGPTDERTALLAAYDAQLRGVAEMGGVLSWDRDGPLYRGLFEHAGFVSYDSLAGVDDVDALIGRTVSYYEGIDRVEQFEWKTRGHDAPADLGTRLEKAGFVPEEVETVMVAEASGRVVAAGRLSRVAGTEFAGLWGGATDPQWRHRSIYRALSAARAGAAIEQGVLPVRPSPPLSRAAGPGYGWVRADPGVPSPRRDGGRPPRRRPARPGDRWHPPRRGPSHRADWSGSG